MIPNFRLGILFTNVITMADVVILNPTEEPKNCLSRYDSDFYSKEARVVSIACDMAVILNDGRELFMLNVTK